MKHSSPLHLLALGLSLVGGGHAADEMTANSVTVRTPANGVPIGTVETALDGTQKTVLSPKYPLNDPRRYIANWTPTDYGEPE